MTNRRPFSLPSHHAPPGTCLQGNSGNGWEKKSLDKVGVHVSGPSWGGGASGSSTWAPAQQGNNWTSQGQRAQQGANWSPVQRSGTTQPGASWSSTGLGPPRTATTAPSSAQPGQNWSNAASSPRASTSSTQPVAVQASNWASTGLTSPEAVRKPRVFNIHQRLRELYLEECRNGRVNENLPGSLRNLKRGSRLLEKLVDRENLNTLIVNLYPGNKGYSLSLRLQGKVPSALGSQAGRSQGSELVKETMRWPYSDEELLRCIDREEVPPTLVDLLESEHSKLFYQGCIIAEIRDSRLTFPIQNNNFETHYVLLKPTTQSILNDVNMLSAAHDLSAEERLSLESQLVQVTAPPLCLDPNPAVGLLLSSLQAKKHRFSTAPLRRTARKFSQVTVNRKRKLDQFTAHNSLQLYDFIVKKRAKATAAKQTKKSGEGVLPPVPAVPRDEPLLLAAPQIEPDVFKHAKHYEKPKETTDCSATLVEEYILETERTQGTIYHIKLTILQRASNAEYLGELYVDKDHKEGERNGASCRFVLGTRAHANRYIQQFTEIFTEEGRKSVRITHVIPGQPGRVSFTQGMRERTGQLAMQAAAAAARAAQSNPPQVPQQVSSLPAAGVAKSPASNLQSVSHLTHLLKSSTVPPNVSVHQIQQQQQTSSVQQPVPGLSNSAIQSILSGALTSASDLSALPNGPTATPPQPTNATVHYQPVPTTVSKPAPSRPTLSSNPQITALATSLRNSVEQFEMEVANQAQAAAAQPSPAAQQNPTIISLLNTHSTPPHNSQPKLVRNPRHTITNNVNSNALRVTLSSFQPQAFSIVTTQGNLPTPTYSLGSLSQPQTQTYTLTPNSGTNQGFTLSPAQNTFTVLQANHNFVQTGQTYTISTPVVPVTQPSGQVFINIPQTIQRPAQTTQRRLSVAHSSELNKLLNDRSDSRVLTERHIAEKTEPGLGLSALSALLVGTPSADNPVPGSAGAGGSSLLDRLTTPTPAFPPPSPQPSSSPGSLSGFTSSSPKSQVQFQAVSPTSRPLSSPTGATPVSLSLQGLSLQGLTNLPQSLQVSIPGIAVPISLSLNVAGQPGATQGVLMTSLPVAATTNTTTTSSAAPMLLNSSSSTPNMVLSNSSPVSSNLLSLPVAHVMGSGSKGNNSRSPASASLSLPQGTAQSIQLVSALQRPSSRSSSSQVGAAPIAARGVVSDQRATSAQIINSANSQMTPMVLSPQQFLTFQKQLSSCLPQKSALSAAAMASKHRRRSSAADPNK